jgi:hypothetical protein
VKQFKSATETASTSGSSAVCSSWNFKRENLLFIGKRMPVGIKTDFFRGSSIDFRTSRTFPFESLTWGNLTTSLPPLLTPWSFGQFSVSVLPFKISRRTNSRRAGSRSWRI